MTSVVFTALLLVAAAPPTLIPQLEGFRPFIGKTWKADMGKGPDGKPMVDVQNWERALNGTTIRITHSINNGMYGGESLVYWDATAKTIAYHYFTTAGFFTQGTGELKDGVFTALEDVKGAEADGTTKVRSTTSMKDGKIYVNAEYFKSGSWTPGRKATYVEDKSAKVIFK